MIAVFPTPYPDELLYSVLARYYIRSGYLAYSYVAEDIFSKKTVRPDVDFLNQYTDDLLCRLEAIKPIESWILENTMYPYYARFCPLERRIKAFEALTNMKGNYTNLLPIPQSKTGTQRYLRYCPKCVSEDRKNYGETYWRRSHQMMFVDCCHEHGCRLISSDVLVGGRASPDLVPAEIIATNDKVTACSEIVRKLSKYIYDVFSSKINFDNDVPAGAFLHSKLSGTSYLTIRGEKRNISLLQKDFSKYYTDFQDNYFTEIYQIQKVFTGASVNCYEVCMIAMFLQIPINELIDMELPNTIPYQQFDDRVFELHRQGLNYAEIARQLGASYDYVKIIGNCRDKNTHPPKPNPMKGGIKTKDYNALDNDTLPMVKELISDLKSDNDRPTKITKGLISRKLDIPYKQLDKMPLCLAEINLHYESQEQYWAREIMWAVDTIIKNDDTLNYKHIRDLTNLRRGDFDSAIKYITDDKVRYLVETL